MRTPLPIPVEFTMPDGWRPPEPAEAEVSGGSIVAVRPAAPGGFPSNIAVTGEYRPDNAQLVDMADEAVARLREAGAEVEVLNRQEVGTPGSPGFTQVLRLGGADHDVVQCQVLLALLDTDDQGERVVLRIVMTTDGDQVAALVRDFQGFLACVRPAGGV